MNPPLSKRESAAWIGLISAALLLRLAGLGGPPLSHDESLHAQFSLYLANGLQYQHDPLMHGPLLFHLNALMAWLFPVNDFTARLMPALWGTGLVALPLLCRRWLGGAGALAAAALLCIDPGHLRYSRYLRNDIAVSFLTLLTVWCAARYLETRRPAYLVGLAASLGLHFATKETCFIHGTVLGLLCLAGAVQDLSRTSWRWQSSLQHPLLHTAVLMLSLALPFTGALLLPLLGGDPLDFENTTGQNQILGLALGLWGFATLGAGIFFFYARRIRTFAVSLGVFWGIQILLFTTLLAHPRRGLASGLSGSLAYWLAQHEVKRGNQDPGFYLSLLLLYSPLLLAGFVAALRPPRDRWRHLLLGWTLGHFVIYSWAGERMPWLLLHISLPLCLLTGPWLVEVLQNPPRCLRHALLWLGCGLGLLQLTANSLRLIGPNASGSKEPLVYAHSGPDIKIALSLIQSHLDRHPGTVLLADPEFFWPMIWYLKGPDVRHESPDPATLPPEVSALLIPPSREIEFTATGWTSRLRVDMTTWPRPQYHELSPENFIRLLTRPAVLRKFLPYYLFREQPALSAEDWPQPHRFLLMTRPSPQDPSAAQP